MRYLFCIVAAVSMMMAPAHASNVAPPGRCVPRKPITITYADNAFKVASTVATKTLFTLASPRVKLCMAVMDPQTTFVGTSITGVSCSIGSDTGGNSAIYLPALNVTQTDESASQGGIFNGRDMAPPDSSLVVRITCTATGGNFGSGSATNLTSGKLWLNIGTIELSAGL